jgi:hypothetical protein
VASPTPSGDTEVELNGVSCSTPTSCFAVGDFSVLSTSSFSVHTLIERWDGTSWSIVPSTSPKGAADVTLSSVSCPAAASCFAVGNYSTSAALSNERTLVEQWNGSTWSIVASANPAGTGDAELLSVSCSSATSCFGVGDVASKSTFGTLAEQWDGASWVIVETPDPLGPPTAARATPHLDSGFSTSPGLSGVSCVSATDCFAVGISSAGNLVEQWNGTTWSVVASPEHEGAESSELVGISCSGPTDCTAVGDFTPTGTKPSEEAFSALAEHWNGTTWSVVSIPSQSTSSEVSSVSCPTATSCAAVGDAAIPDHWNGTSWSLASFAAKTSQSNLAHVSCPSATSCFAVGSYSTTSVQKTLIEHWNGTSWAVIASPNPRGADVAELSSVACPTATDCIAVGSADTSSSQKTLTERWNGTTWKIVPSPNPPNADVAELLAVACPSATSCNAVGLTLSKTAASLAEHWNGTTWSIAPSASPAGTGLTITDLIGVACPTATNCIAVGFSSTFNGKATSAATLSERWNGVNWTIVPSPELAGRGVGILTAVSCSSVTNCTGVGETQSALDAAKTITLVEHWNGASWTVVASPNPTAASVATFAGISCRSAASCYAVGRYTTATTNGTLVEHSNGTTWSIVSSAGPAGTTTASLSSISCPNATSCVAVGTYSIGNNSFTLAERGS